MRKKLICGFVMIMMMCAGCTQNITTDSDLSDEIGFEESVENSEVETESESVEEYPIYEKFGDVYIVYPMEEVLNSKLSERIVQYGDVIVPIDYSMTANEVIELLMTSELSANISFGTIDGIMTEGHGHYTIYFEADGVENGKISVYNPGDEERLITECYVDGLWADYVCIPPGGIFDVWLERRPTVQQERAGCADYFYVEDLAVFMDEQGFVQVDDRSFNSYGVTYMDEQVYYYIYHCVADVREGMCYVEQYPLILKEENEIPADVLAEFKAKYPEYYN